MRPVNRIKHIVDIQQGITAATQANQVLVEAVQAPAVANVREVNNGSTVNAIYLTVEAYATTAGALSNLYMIVFKNPGGNLTVPQGNTVGSNDNKKYVIHQEMVMLQQAVNGNVRNVFKGVIVIPKGYRRFGVNDLLQISFYSPGVNCNVCFQCIYREFK